MIESGAINRKVAKKVFEAIFDEDVDPEVYVEENGLKTVNDEGALRKVIEEIVANNPKSVEDYKAGKKKAMGFFVGQTMRAMKGKADPAMVNQILKEMLDKFWLTQVNRRPQKKKKSIFVTLVENMDYGVRLWMLKKTQNLIPKRFEDS